MSNATTQPEAGADGTTTGALRTVRLGSRTTGAGATGGDCAAPARGRRRGARGRGVTARGGGGLRRGRGRDEPHRRQVDDVPGSALGLGGSGGFGPDVDHDRTGHVVVPAAPAVTGVHDRGPREGGQADAERGDGGEPEHQPAQQRAADADRRTRAEVYRPQADRRLARRGTARAQRDGEDAPRRARSRRRPVPPRARSGRRARSSSYAAQQAAASTPQAIMRSMSERVEAAVEPRHREAGRGRRGWTGCSVMAGTGRLRRGRPGSSPRHRGR